MLFNSIEYVVFLPIVLLITFGVPASCRWLVLLLASYVFYMAWVPTYLVLILFSTVVDFAAGLALGRLSSTVSRRLCLASSIAANLGLLFAFKYYGFLADSAATVARLFGFDEAPPVFDVLLPVGISFYTFQTLSYTFEVYNRRQAPERHFGRFALYVAFFPQLVAGPIERPGHLLPQLRQLDSFRYGMAVTGMRLILWGLFKKMVVADRLGQIVDRVYDAPQLYEGPALFIATVAFAFQILCDFSGYTDIAIGSARLFGVDLMQNFRRPYSAGSIREFWQRWHVSLSTWFRDYVYIPLGGNRVGLPRHYVNLGITFAVSGLWHGANWTFVLWGLYHAVLYVFGDVTRSARDALIDAGGLRLVPRLGQFLSVLWTFSLVCAGWVLFRAETLSDAVYVWTSMPDGWSIVLRPDAPVMILDQLRLSTIDAGIAISGVIAMSLGEYLRFDANGSARLAATPRVMRWAIYLAGAFVVSYLGVKDDVAFIYFQF